MHASLPQQTLMLLFMVRVVIYVLRTVQKTKTFNHPAQEIMTIFANPFTVYG